MTISNFFKFEGTIISPGEIFSLTEDMLDDFYSDSGEIERINIFFHLQNELLYLKAEERKKEAAYVSYLISYYIFYPLTPPHSEELALYYAKEALALHNTIKYQDWIKVVEEGN